MKLEQISSPLDMAQITQRKKKLPQLKLKKKAKSKSKSKRYKIKPKIKK